MEKKHDSQPSLSCGNAYLVRLTTRVTTAHQPSYYLSIHRSDGRKCRGHESMWSHFYGLRSMTTTSLTGITLEFECLKMQMQDSARNVCADTTLSFNSRWVEFRHMAMRSADGQKEIQEYRISSIGNAETSGNLPRGPVALSTSCSICCGQ